MLSRHRTETGVEWLVLNRPAARNALSLEMLTALEAALADIATSDTRCVILAAEGPVFSSGHDLKEMRAHREDPDGGRGFYTQAMAACARVMQAVVNLPQPVIAAVEGVATAAGCQLVASCDLAVATPNARFCTPGVDIGLFCSTPAVAISRAIGRRAAMDMLLTGRMVEAEEARAMGLLNRVAADARATALALAEGIAARSQLTIRMGKAGFNAQATCALPEAYAQAAAVMVDNMMAEDAKEGIGAFLEKRAPQWQDK
ncbi:enoyl-CoA hydratase [Rhodovarius sp.]|uniref:enoyl-CoA hydratase n=1 Tax=Rhodovarius sp. TaxID=2972673 RepID=UPI0034A51F05